MQEGDGAVNGKGYDQEGTLASFYLDGRPGFGAPEGRPGSYADPALGAPDERVGGGFVAPEGRPSGGFVAPEGRPGGGYPVPDGRIPGTYGLEGRPGGGGMHSVQVLNREQTVVQGVTAVEAFDDQEIILETEMGGLTLRGEDLQIRQLDLESGKFAVDGLITAIMYTESRQRGGRPSKGRGFLERLLK
jgi:sporulation protein YabP